MGEELRAPEKIKGKREETANGIGNKGSVGGKGEKGG